MCENGTKSRICNLLLALMLEACPTIKLDKDFWLDVLRPGLKKLHAVLKRVGKSEISALIKQGQRLRAPAALPYSNIR